MTRRSLALVLGLLLAACSSAAGSEPLAGETDLRAETVIVAPTGSATAVDVVREPLLPEGVHLMAIPRQRLMPVWEEPGAGEPDFLFDVRNPLGERAPLLVADARRVNGEAWYEVYLPIRPNGSTAWLRPGEVKLRENDHRIEVDLSELKLRYIVDGEVLERISVGIGTASTPTATGTFYVWVKVPYLDPYQSYGIMALGLSGFSEVLTDWPGGGRMAVHGTPNAADRGRAVSHGCVRVYNEDMKALLRVPLGTPVIISR